MKNARKIELDIQLDGKGKVVIDGHDVSALVTSIEFKASALHKSELVLGLVAERVLIRGNVDALRAYMVPTPETAKKD